MSIEKELKVVAAMENPMTLAQISNANPPKGSHLRQCGCCFGNNERFNETDRPRLCQACVNMDDAGQLRDSNGVYRTI